MSGSLPDLSVVLACTDRFATIAATVSRLRAQTIRERIELVIVATSRAALDLPVDAVSGFWGHRIVEVGQLDSIAGANVALWWIPVGHRPTVAESADRLRRVRESGPTPYAFTLRKSFPQE
jgi:hypothetical protein